MKVTRDRMWRRWMFGGSCLVCLVLLALPALALFLPGRLGDVAFQLGLAAWWLPAHTLMWTGLFRYHEFGGGPTGPLGLLLTLLVYVGLSWLVSRLPIGRPGKGRSRSETAKDADVGGRAPDDGEGPG